jgi:hypothetical protein
MFNFRRQRQTAAETDTSDRSEDRDLIALVNEARTPDDLSRATALARLRHPR